MFIFLSIRQSITWIWKEFPEFLRVNWSLALSAMRNDPGMGKKKWNQQPYQEIYFWHNWTVRRRSAKENSTCSFLAIVGGHCGSDTKDRTGSVEMVPLLSCNRDISRHNSFFSIIGNRKRSWAFTSKSVNFCTTTKCRKLDSMSSTSCIFGCQLETQFY